MSNFRKRFDKKFLGWQHGGMAGGSSREIKDFIAQELKREREKVATRLRVIRANIPLTYGGYPRKQLKELIEELKVKGSQSKH